MNVSIIHLPVEQKLTRGWKKDSCTTRAIRKEHMESGRKGGEGIRLLTVPLGGDSEEGEHCLGGDSPWGVNSSSHILGFTALGSDTGKTSPLALLEGQGLTDGLREAWTPLVRSTHVLAYSCNRVGGRLKLQVSRSLSGECSSLS